MIQAVALMSVFGLGVAFSIIGSLKLELAKKLNIDDGKVGGLISALMFSSLIVVIIMGPLVDIFGYKPIAILGFLIGFISVFLLISAKTYTRALFSCILLGVGAMSMNLGNTLLPMVLFGGQNAPAASNFGNVFFGLGAFISPFLIGILLKKLGYRTTGNIIAFVILVPIVFAILATYPVISGGFDIGQAIGLLSQGIIIASALALFCYISLEVSMAGWITTYATSIGITARNANIILSGFWISVMIARLVTATIITPQIGSTIIVIFALLACISIGIMVMTKSKVFAGTAIILTGFAFGPIFPTIVGLTFDKIDPTLHGSAFGIIFSVGLLGGSTIPAAIGFYSKGKTIQKSLVIALAAAVILLVIGIVMGKM